MGFMQQFQQSSPITELIGAARRLANGDPSQVVGSLMRSGATCTLPDGRVVTVKQLAQMVAGKSPQEMFAQFGPQYADIQRQLQSFM